MKRDMSIVGVQVLNFGNPSDALSLISSLNQYQKKMVDFRHALKILFIDNFSSFENRQKIIECLDNPQFDGVKFILLSDNKGYGPGINEGFQYFFSLPNVVAVLALNPDVIFPEINLQYLLNVEMKNRELFTFPVTSKNALVARGLYKIGKIGLRSIPSPQTYSDGREPFFPSGCCWGMTAKIWNSTQGFSQSLFLYYEEMEFILRFFLMKKRYPLVEVIPGDAVFHSVGGTMPRVDSKRSIITLFYSCRNRIYITRKYLKFWLPFSLFYNFIILVRSIVGGELSECRAIVNGCILGLRKIT